MKNFTQVRSSLLLISIVMIVSCNAMDQDLAVAKPGPTPAASAAPQHAEPRQGLESSDPRQLQVPAAYRFQKEIYTIRANSWQEFLQTVTAEEATYLKQVDANYFGALSYANPQMLRDLASDGFPLPEEWLEARKMSDAELKALSDGGSNKAKLFYLDRLLDQASQYLDLRNNKNESAYRNSPGPRLSLLAYELATQLQASYKSPFGGYLSGYVYSRLNYPASPESAAAGIFVAFDRGDKRAIELLRQFQTQHPNLDMSAVLAAYSSLK